MSPNTIIAHWLIDFIIVYWFSICFFYILIFLSNIFCTYNLIQIFRHSLPWWHCWYRPKSDRIGHEPSPAHRRLSIEPWMQSLSMMMMTLSAPACWPHSAQRHLVVVLESMFCHRHRRLWLGCWTSRLCVVQWMAVKGGNSFGNSVLLCYVRIYVLIRYVEFANLHFS